MVAASLGRNRTMAKAKQVSYWLLKAVAKTVLALGLTALALLSIFLVIYTLAYPQPPSQMDVGMLVGNSFLAMLLFAGYAAYSTRLRLRLRLLAFAVAAGSYILALFALHPFASYVVWIVSLILVADVLEFFLRRFMKSKSPERIIEK